MFSALNAFDSVTVVNAAVADKRGTLVLYQSPDDPEVKIICLARANICVEVATISLDDDLASRGIQKVDLLKIDVEGAELLVLAGAARLLGSNAAPTVIIEVNPVSLRSANSDPAAVLGWLQSRGYRCSELERFVYKGETVVNILASLELATGVVT